MAVCSSLVIVFIHPPRALPLLSVILVTHSQKAHSLLFVILLLKKHVSFLSVRATVLRHSRGGYQRGVLLYRGRHGMLVLRKRERFIT